MDKKEIEEIFYEIYELTKDITVTKYDCGMLCDKRCCETSTHSEKTVMEEDLGMELYPGEEMMLRGEPWLTWRFLSGKEYHLPVGWKEEEGIYFVSCKQPCPRDKRPLQCRLFPYRPTMKPNGNVVLEIEKGGPNFCPIPDSDLDPLARKQLEKAVQLLLTIPKVRELLWWDAQP